LFSMRNSAVTGEKPPGVGTIPARKDAIHYLAMNMQTLRERRAKNIQKTEAMLDRFFGSGAPVQMPGFARKAAALVLPWLYLAAAIYFAYIAKELIEWHDKFSKLLGAFGGSSMNIYLYL